MMTFFLTLKFFFQQKTQEIKEYFKNNFKSSFGFFLRTINFIVTILSKAPDIIFLFAFCIVFVFLFGFFTYLIIDKTLGFRLVDTCSNWILPCSNRKLESFFFAIVCKYFVIGLLMTLVLSYCSYVTTSAVRRLHYLVRRFVFWIKSNWFIAQNRAQTAMMQKTTKSKKKYR